MKADKADLQAIFKRFGAVAPVWWAQAAIETIVLAVRAAFVLRRDWPENRFLDIFALYIQAVIGLTRLRQGRLLTYPKPSTLESALHTCPSSQPFLSA